LNPEVDENRLSSDEAQTAYSVVSDYISSGIKVSRDIQLADVALQSG